MNLIMDREVVTELIQGDFNKKRLTAELSAILETKKREQLFLEYYELEKILGGRGASDNAAKLIYESVANLSDRSV